MTFHRSLALVLYPGLDDRKTHCQYARGNNPAGIYQTVSWWYRLFFVLQPAGILVAPNGEVVRAYKRNQLYHALFA